jgi:quercetin 2,3-dioxygenase
VAVLTGHVTVNGNGAGEAEIVRFEREGSKVTIRADSDAMLLVLTGQPLDQPVYGYGPFVMTNEAEVRQAIDDFNGGRFGQVAHA